MYHHFYRLLVISSTIISGIPISTNAGIKELTWHSRANCVNNESITWHLGHNYKLSTDSSHTQYNKPNTISAHDIVSKHRECSAKNCDEYETTWRSAVVHWGEASPKDNWTVYGRHGMIKDNGKYVYLGDTYANDCSIYDGWWD